MADRVQMPGDMRHRDGKSPAIVRYNDGHNPEDEWIYNDAIHRCGTDNPGRVRWRKET
jgi:hypothetical protein